VLLLPPQPTAASASDVVATANARFTGAQAT
jgi:hypothetical protein